ncbi:MAG: TIM barrel protein [Clostridia bacterium]
MSIKFGPGGNAKSFAESGHKTSVDAPKWLHDMGLNAYEYQCGRGVAVGEKTAKEIGREALENDIAMSLHAPYFMNLANADEERQRKTVDYVLQSCAAARAMGATRIVIHSGSLLKRTREEALTTARETLAMVVEECDRHDYGDITLCPELMGCVNQLGTLSEVMELCKVDARLVPCIDFGHYNARNFGILKEKKDFLLLFDTMEQAIGRARMERFHAHFSKIKYSETAGEIKHLTFEDSEYGPDFHYAAQIIAERGYEPTIICESAGTQAEDALAMKLEYEKERDAI